MRFALFCDDPSAGHLVDALGVQTDGHQLSYAVRMNVRSEDLIKRDRAVSVVGHWEDLLTVQDLDAVIFGGSDPGILEGAKQLATAGIPLLFLPQAAQGSTFVYELSLIRDDNHVPLVPLFWHRFDPAAIQLKARLNAGGLGRVQLLQLQRTLSQSSASGTLAKSDVDAELVERHCCVAMVGGGLRPGDKPANPMYGRGVASTKRGSGWSIIAGSQLADPWRSCRRTMAIDGSRRSRDCRTGPFEFDVPFCVRD